jgi:putative ubiquitin-RnfH superfamily antitoxin RatB of RatAB toxin-antitoxin module
VIKVFLKGPDGKQKTVTINEDATVRDVASDGYHLFFCSIRLNSEKVPPTARVHDGDRVEVVAEVIRA